jgi:allophanate hydrolase
VWEEVDFVLTPTAGTIYTIAEVEADPVRLNSRLGTYMNFMNLLDLAAVAVPAGFKANGLPLGVTLFAPAWQDEALLEVASSLHPCGVDVAGATGEPLPASSVCPALDGMMQLAVCGAHLLGGPLNHQLTERGGVRVREARTAPTYRFYALAGTTPPKPGLAHIAEGGAAIEVEVWALPLAEAADFISAIPAPLVIGKLLLEDGSQVSGFLCEPRALNGAEEITHLGGWRAYQQKR